MRIILRSIILGIVMPLAAGVVQVQAAETKEEVSLKKLATEFYNVAINEKDFDKASKYLAPHYIQHSFTAPDGVDGLKMSIAGLKKTMPDFHGDIKQSFVDGKTVILHVQVKRKEGDPGLNVVDILRFDENNKVAEHWDVAQELPSKTENPNPPL